MPCGEAAVIGFPAMSEGALNKNRRLILAVGYGSKASVGCCRVLCWGCAGAMMGAGEGEEGVAHPLVIAPLCVC